MKYSKDNLIFVPLGGSGEIGMNCNLIHFKNHWIMIDLGVTFNDNELGAYDLSFNNMTEEGNIYNKILLETYK